MQPIPGQPGLYRSRGLGETPAGVQQRLQDLRSAIEQEWGEVQTSVQGLLDRFGAFQPSAFMLFLEQILPLRGRNVILSPDTLANVMRGVLSPAYANLSLAKRMLSAAPSVVYLNRYKIEALLRTARRVLSAVRVMVQGARVATSGVSGLGLIFPGPIPIDSDLLFTVVQLLAAYAAARDAQEASRAADEACRRMAAQGQSCSGEDWARARQAALEEARRHGVSGLLDAASEGIRSVTPNLDRLVGTGESLLFWGGMLVVAAGLGYLFFVSAPATLEIRRGATAAAQAVREEAEFRREQARLRRTRG